MKQLTKKEEQLLKRTDEILSGPSHITLPLDIGTVLGKIERLYSGDGSRKNQKETPIYPFHQDVRRTYGGKTQ